MLRKVIRRWHQFVKPWAITVKIGEATVIRELYQVIMPWVITVNSGKVVLVKKLTEWCAGDSKNKPNGDVLRIVHNEAISVEGAVGQKKDQLDDSTGWIKNQDGGDPSDYLKSCNSVYYNACTLLNDWKFVIRNK